MNATEYLRESARTASGQFHAEIVNPAEVDFMLQAVITAGTWADRLKRALFYGKKPPGDSRWSTSSVSLVPEMADLIHAMLGCVTESAEIAEHVRDVLTGAKPLDNVNLLEELGDQTWYIALALRYLESNFGEIFDGNIAKLRKRFLDKFTEAAAINRDLDGERAVLEQAQIVPANRLPEPQPFSLWQHTSGVIYEVLFLTNRCDNPRYPRTVIYRGSNGNTWSRRADDWHRSMTAVVGPLSQEPIAAEAQAELPGV
jgi:NTP pyrophosphatase (non-canonical NTP hydrolase)